MTRFFSFGDFYIALSGDYLQGSARFFAALSMTLSRPVMLSAAKNLAREVVQRTYLSHLEDLEGITKSSPLLQGYNTWYMLGWTMLCCVASGYNSTVKRTYIMMERK